MAKAVADMTPGQAVSFALDVMLNQGFESKYYKTWQDYSRENYDDDPDSAEYDEDYPFVAVQSSGAWGAFEEYVKTGKSYESDGITVKYEGNQNDGPAHGSSEYFVIFSLEDSTGKRFFKRDGYYNSYEGGNLVDASDSEVFPKPKLVTLWRSQND